MLCRKHQLGPKSLIQVCEGQVSALPADLRRWPGATAKVVDLQAVLNRPPESVDVLSTRCLFSSRDALKDGGGMVEDELRMLGATVAPNGVWHFMEALPAEQPVHWLFTFFPELWAVAVMQGLPLHHLCKLMQQIGFVCEVKRHRFYQPVTLAAALAMAEARPGLLRRLDDQTYQQGLARLSQAVAAQGAEYPAGSETTVVEIWAQKVVKQAKAREG